MKKSNKRIDIIKSRITNELSKNNVKKYYQIKSYIEYKQLKSFVNELGINYELLWCNPDSELKMNKLEKIIGGYYYCCCTECDRPMTYINKKIPLLYCYLHEK